MISYTYAQNFPNVFHFPFTHITYDAVNLSPVCFKEFYLDMNWWIENKSRNKRFREYFDWYFAFKSYFIAKSITKLDKSHSLPSLLRNQHKNVFSKLHCSFMGVRDSRRMSYEPIKKWVCPYIYPPQILMVCMYIGRKLALQTKIL